METTPLPGSAGYHFATRFTKGSAKEVNRAQLARLPPVERAEARRCTEALRDLSRQFPALYGKYTSRATKLLVALDDLEKTTPQVSEPVPAGN